jgi:hypothetical protein
MSKKTWVKTAVAASELSISVDYLLELRQGDWFMLGVHYRIVSKPNALRRSYRWDVKAIADLFSAHSVGNH